MKASASGRLQEIPIGMDVNPGYPRLTMLLVDGIKSAFAQPVAFVASMLIVALTCLIVLVTAGRTAATERQVLASIDGVGARLLTVVDTGNAMLHPDTVSAISELPGVEWALGFGSASDVLIEAQGTLLGTVSTGVPVRRIVGELPTDFGYSDLSVIAGRLPMAEGEAFSGYSAAIRLGLLDGAGPITTSEVSAPVVGVARLSGGLLRFDDSVLIAATPETVDELRFIYVVAEDATTVLAVAANVRSVIHAGNLNHITIETPDSVVALRDVVSGQLGASARQLMAATLGVGVVVVGATMLGMVSSKRRDFGRRRALGASRSAIVFLVLIYAAVAAFCGTVLGIGAGITAVRFAVGDVPTAVFTIGLAILTIMAALIGALPPAIIAARRDPVRILRVP